MSNLNQLANLQKTFQGCVLSPDKSATTQWIRTSGRASPETQLSKYAYAYTARLKEVLGNDFPAVLMAIGDEHFNRLADDYINEYPSQYFSLRDFGQHLPSFIATQIQTDKNYQGLDWLFELAVFEWSLGQSFDAADATIFSEADMAVISPEAWPGLRFTLHPSVQRLDFEWNVTEIWQILTSETPTAISAEHDVASAWLLWRENLTTRFRSMSDEEQRTLDTVLNGGSFNDVCEVLAMSLNEEDVPMHAAGFLKGWISQGLITGVTKEIL